MTKKDYTLIAGAFKQQLAEYKMMWEYCYEKKDTDSARMYISKQTGVEFLAIGLAKDLQDENPKFDTDKFLYACGVSN